jgi:hypothetical protein
MRKNLILTAALSSALLFGQACAAPSITGEAAKELVAKQGGVVRAAGAGAGSPDDDVPDDRLRGRQ